MSWTNRMRVSLLVRDYQVGTLEQICPTDAACHADELRRLNYNSR